MSFNIYCLTNKSKDDNLGLRYVKRNLLIVLKGLKVNKKSFQNLRNESNESNNGDENHDLINTRSYDSLPVDLFT